MIQEFLSRHTALSAPGSFVCFLAVTLGAYQWLGPVLFECRLGREAIELFFLRFIPILKIKYGDVAEIGPFHYSRFFHAFKWRRAHLSLNFISRPFSPRVLIELRPVSRYRTVVLTPADAEAFIAAVQLRKQSGWDTGQN
jgi:hypothetical protein